MCAFMGQRGSVIDCSGVAYSCSVLFSPKFCVSESEELVIGELGGVGWFGFALSSSGKFACWGWFKGIIMLSSSRSNCYMPLIQFWHVK